MDCQTDSERIAGPKSHYQVVTELFEKHFGKDQIFTGIEIGTGAADLTVTIMNNFQNCHIHTIDPWVHVDGAEFEAGEPQQRHDNAQKIARQRIEPFKDRATILHMTSKEALIHAPKEVDFVWIDGDHTGQTVEFDCDSYLPLVKKGGIFGGHDFGQVHPLTEIIMKKFNSRLNSGNDFTWWIYI